MAAIEEKSIVSTHEQVPQISRPGPMPSRFGPAVSSGGMTGKDLLRAIRRRIWMIVIIVFFTTALVGVGTYVWATNAPLYASEAVVVVNPPKSEVKIGFADLTPREIMDRLGNQNLRVVRDADVMRKVLSAPEVKESKWFRKGQDVDANLKRLMDEVSVSYIPAEGAIRITMTGPDAKEVTQIVNAVATVAVDNSRRFIADRYTESLNENRRKYDELVKNKDNLLLRQKALRPRDIPMFEQKVNDLSLTLSSLRTDIQHKTDELREAESGLKNFEASPSPESAAEVQQAVDQDSTYRTLQMQQAAVQTDRDNAVQKYGPRHRKVLEMENKLESITRQMDDARQLALKRGVGAVRSFYQGQVNKKKEQLLGLQDDFDKTAANMQGMQETLDTIKDLGDQIARLNEQIKVAGTRVEDIGILSQQDNPLSIRVPASQPLEPKWPTYWFVPLGFVLGLLISLGLTFLLEFMDSSVRSTGDITRRMDLPVLGLIPHSDDLEEEIGDLRLAFVSHPNSLVSESFRQIRTSLLFSGPAANRRSLLVASAQPEDGRTTVALNLAAAIARGGRKVLVVDANFRQSAIRKIFPQCREAGLSNVLTGQSAWRDLICQVEPNLCVLSSGPLPPNPAELLGGESMRQLVTELGSQFDQVIFDGAPLLVVSDSRILATMVDSAMIVVRAGANTHGVVKRSNDMLTQVGARVIGMALNGVRATRGGYLRKSYETFYDYHQQILPGGPPPQG